MAHRLVPLILLVLWLASAQAAEPPTPADNEAFHSQVERILRDEHVPGGAVALVDATGPVWVGSFGVTKANGGAPVDGDTVFRTGSVGKSMVALGLMKLQEEGKLAIDMPVRDVAPEVQIVNPWTGDSPVRIAHLLEHTSGFDDMTLSEVRNRLDDPRIPLLDVFRKFPGPQNVRWRPGTKVAYSNPGYSLAGYVIEAVTKRRFEDYVKGEILDPLGMSSSNWDLTPAIQAHLATGYAGDPPKPLPYYWTYMRPGGELKSTAADLGRWVAMLINHGRTSSGWLVSPESIARLEHAETSTAARAGLDYSLGAGVETDLSKAFKTLGKGGAIDGFVATYQYLPDIGLGYVILLNSDSPSALDRIERLAVAFLTRGREPPPVPAIPASRAQLEGLAGFYEPTNPRAELGRFIDELTGGRWLSVADGVLTERALFEPGRRLLPVRDLQFRYEGDSGATRIFVPTDKHGMIMAGRSAYYERRSALWPMTRLVLLFVAVVVLTVSPLVLLTLLIVRRRRMPTKRLWLSPYALSSAAVLCVIVMGVALGNLQESLDPRGKDAYAFFIASLGLPVLTAGLIVVAILSIRRKSSRSSMNAIGALALAVCASIITAFAATWHFVGFQPWRY